MDTFAVADHVPRNGTRPVVDTRDGWTQVVVPAIVLDAVGPGTYALRVEKRGDATAASVAPAMVAWGSALLILPLLVAFAAHRQVTAFRSAAAWPLAAGGGPLRWALWLVVGLYAVAVGVTWSGADAAGAASWPALVLAAVATAALLAVWGAARRLRLASRAQIVPEP